MTNTNELAKIIREYYNEQVRIGKAKKFDECKPPCVPVANITPYLKSLGIDWRTEFKFNKLPDLLKSLEGIDIFYRGVPYIYVDSLDATQKVQKDYTFIPKKQTNCDSLSQTYALQPYQIRNAYRKISTKPEEWVPIQSIKDELQCDETAIQTLMNHKFLQINAKLVRVHNISKYELVDDVYFTQKNNFPSNVEKLRIMALDENWDDNGKRNGLLENYLLYTYARVKDEKKIAYSEDKLHACWNTGLVDYRYEPIYCYLIRKDVEHRWLFKSFCINGEDSGKEMGRNILDMPERATYFKEKNLLCQPSDVELSVDRDHIIREHPSRLPSSWLKDILNEKSDWLPDETPTQYDKRIGDLLPKGSQRNMLLQTLLQQTIDESVKRCQWNYKTAIPYYDPIYKNVGWFLPLCISKDEEVSGKRSHVPFAALVVSKGVSGRFQGETIYNLSWAFRCARLVCRPDSDWLTPLFMNDDKNDMEE